MLNTKPAHFISRRSPTPVGLNETGCRRSPICGLGGHTRPPGLHSRAGL